MEDIIDCLWNGNIGDVLFVERFLEVENCVFGFLIEVIEVWEIEKNFMEEIKGFNEILNYLECVLRYEFVFDLNELLIDLIFIFVNRSII